MLERPNTPTPSVHILPATPGDIPAILRLQAEHLNPQGLSWQTTADDLRFQDAATILAKVDHRVVGYLLTFDLEHHAHFSQAKHLFRYIDHLAYAGQAIRHHRTCLGQVLVDRRFQGQGIGQKLYAGFLRAHQERYAVRLASIHEHNQPALLLHTQKLGMEEIGRFSTDTGMLVVLVWDLRTRARQWVQQFACRR